VQTGQDPPNAIRDPAQNHALETSCWNTVMTPEQFEAMKHTLPVARGRGGSAAALETADA
jgi:hypothetical protein